LNRLLFPGPTRQFEQTRETFGDISVLDTVDYLYGLDAGVEHTVDIGRGVRLYVGLEAIGEPDAKGMRTVMATMNGQLRPVFVRDSSITDETKSAEKADASQPGHVAAPFAGVVSLKVTAGTLVAVGEAVASIEAMKMEAAITAPIAGRIERIAISPTQQVEAGDLLVVISPVA
jgi:pyruvate carboxylase